MRRAASVVLAGLVLVGVSGCEFITPQDTVRINQVSDGVDYSVGSIDVRNAMLFSLDGRTAVLVTSLINSSGSAVPVQLAWTAKSGPASTSVQVPGNALVNIRPGSGGTPVQLSGITAPVGSTFRIRITAGSKTADMDVPVLDNTLPGYSTLTPTPPAPSAPATVAPAPSESATPGVTSSAAPTPTSTP